MDQVRCIAFGSSRLDITPGRLWQVDQGSPGVRAQATARDIISLTKDSIMASAFSHAFVAAALGSTYARRHMPWHFWALSITCAILPDADVIGFALWAYPTTAPGGHRGMSHSFCFAFVLSLGVVSLFFREQVVFCRGYGGAMSCISLW